MQLSLQRPLNDQLVGDYYYVNNMPFVLKTEALTYASKIKHNVAWSYYDEVFTSYDWKKPIETSLPELYKKRAQQLRDKYDYVSLFFSGGVDSTNILHSFIENDIFLDEIVMYYPKRIESRVSTTDTSSFNQTAEILYAAVPHLKEYLKTSKTLVRFIDMGAAVDTFLADREIVSQFYHVQFMGAQMLARKAILFTDKIWTNLYESGKRVAHVNGCDKPIINILNDRYHFQFSDWMRPFAIDSGGAHEFAQRFRLYQHHEPFYWTPDMPELVIKQCQIMKRLAESDEAFKAMFTDCYNSLGDRFVESIIPHIYPPQVNSIRQRFAVRKGATDTYSWWFNASSPAKSVGVFSGIQQHLRSSIHPAFFGKDGKDFVHYRSRPYEL